MHFENPDYEKFEGLKICRESLNKSTAYRCILNVANEVAVEAFLQKRI
jgi:1-deoxy-D-xylulose 5-phosphate reductoisomerase